jgi:hypothetical protein
MGSNLEPAALLAEGHEPANRLPCQSAAPKTILMPATATDSDMKPLPAEPTA